MQAFLGASTRFLLLKLDQAYEVRLRTRLPGLKSYQPSSAASRASPSLLCRTPLPTPAKWGVRRVQRVMLIFPGGCTQRATILHPQPCTVCTRHGCIHFFHEHAQLPFGRVGGGRLLVRSRCRASTMYRVRGHRLSGHRVVRHNGSTPPMTPTVCLVLLPSHALSPACSLRCPRTRCLRPSNLSFSSACSPSLPADVVSILNPTAG